MYRKMFDRPPLSEPELSSSKKEGFSVDPHELDDLGMSPVEELPDVDTPSKETREKQESGNPKIPSMVGSTDWQAEAACRPSGGRKTSTTSTADT